MAAIFDIIGAFIIIAVLAFLVLNAQLTVQKYNYSAIYDSQDISYSNLYRIALRNDISQAGSNTVQKDRVIYVASRDTLAYYTNGDSTRVKYYLKNFTTSPYKNPNIKDLIKETNGTATSTKFAGVSVLRFYYYDKNGVSTTNTADITFVGFTMQVESLDSVTQDRSGVNQYQKVFIEERVLLKNLMPQLTQREF